MDRESHRRNRMGGGPRNRQGRRAAPRHLQWPRRRRRDRASGTLESLLACFSEGESAPTTHRGRAQSFPINGRVERLKRTAGEEKCSPTPSSTQRRTTATSSPSIPTTKPNPPRPSNAERPDFDRFPRRPSKTRGKRWPLSDRATAGACAAEVLPRHSKWTGIDLPEASMHCSGNTTTSDRTERASLRRRSSSQRLLRRIRPRTLRRPTSHHGRLRRTTRTRTGSMRMYHRPTPCAATREASAAS